MDIEITLLLTKQHRAKIDGLDLTIATNRNGYTIISGENNATTIQVNYFTDYRNYNRYVYMQNSKGAYAIIDFAKGQNSVTFTLPNTMTYAGNTLLTFYATNETSTTIWAPVVVPITATGVDYKAVALANEDLLVETIQKADAAMAIAKSLTAPPDCTNANNVGVANVSIDSSNRFVFANLRGIQGIEGPSGANAVIMWGKNGQSIFSNVKWRII